MKDIVKVKAIRKKLQLKREEKQNIKHTYIFYLLYIIKKEEEKRERENKAK